VAELLQMLLWELPVVVPQQSLGQKMFSVNVSVWHVGWGTGAVRQTLDVGAHDENEWRGVMDELPIVERDVCLNVPLLRVG
jgi:hypothetical protein